MEIALTIGGFDPSSGAGITADLAVFSAHGLFGTSCLTAVTVQSTMGVRSVHPSTPELLRATLEELCADMPPAGIKIGMLADQAVTEAVANFLESTKRARRCITVLDPVLRSTSGMSLLDPDAGDTLRTRLLPFVDCVTPNVAELSTLLSRELRDRDDVAGGAHELQGLGRDLHVIVTGGDQLEPDDFVLPSDGKPEWLAGTRVDTTSTHGTGCAFSSAVLCHLLRGREIVEAARRAKRFVEGALRCAPGLGRGRGPTDLLWPLRVRQDCE